MGTSAQFVVDLHRKRRYGACERGDMNIAALRNLIIENIHVSVADSIVVEANVLALEKKEGGSLIAEVKPMGEKAFNFKLVGGPPADKGLDFNR